MKTTRLVPLLVCLVAGAGARPAAAQDIGVRVGVSANPDQFYFGGHANIGPVVEELWFRPNIEIGVGDDVTLAAFNFEFVYRMPLKRNPWRLYVGGGPALNLSRRPNKTSPGGGFNIVLGLEHARGLFTEVKVGALDSPGFKFGIGYTFRP
jgi:hypothetical protein